MSILKKIKAKYIIIIGIVIFVGFIVAASVIMFSSARKAINITVEKMSDEQTELAKWLEEDAETYEITFTPVNIAGNISDYFTYVEDEAGNKYVIALPYDYTFSTSSTGDNITVNHENEFSEDAANNSAYIIQNVISDDKENLCSTIKCLAYKSSLNFIYTEKGKEQQLENAVGIREVIQVH